MEFIPITLVGGKGGNGKSLFGISEAMQHWIQGGCVCISAHLRVYWDDFKLDVLTGKPCKYNCKTFAKDVHGVELHDDQFVIIPLDKVKDFYEVVPHGSPELHVLCIMDEAHEDFNARNWAEMHREHPKTLSFLSHCRHYFVSVIFMTQSILNLDKQFMRLVQYIWKMRDMVKRGMPGMPFLPWPFPQWRFCRTKLDEDGKTFLGISFFTLDKRLYDLYDSFSDVEGVKRNGMFRKKKLVKSARKLTMRTWITIIVLLGLMFYWGLHKLRGTALGRVVFHDKSESSEVPVPEPDTMSLLHEHEQLESMRRYQPAANDDLRPVVDNKGVKTSYDILSERFKGFIGGNAGPDLLITDQCVYQAGQMSIHGACVKVEPLAAEIIEPDGRKLVVLAVADGNSGVQSRSGTFPVMPPAIPVSSIPGLPDKSPWFQRDTSFVDAESDRIKSAAAARVVQPAKKPSN